MRCIDCKTLIPLKVCHSNAGYYVGRFCKNCGPYSIVSGYWKTRKQAEIELKIIKEYP